MEKPPKMADPIYGYPFLFKNVADLTGPIPIIKEEIADHRS